MNTPLSSKRKSNITEAVRILTQSDKEKYRINTNDECEFYELIWWKKEDLIESEDS